MSEFAELKSDLKTLRQELGSGLSALDARIGGLDTRLIRVEAKLDEKPGTATIYQAALTIFAGIFAAVVGTVVILKNLGAMP